MNSEFETVGKESQTVKTIVTIQIFYMIYVKQTFQANR